MEIGGLLAIAATFSVLAGVTALVARGPEALGGMFHAEVAGWPYGVQEDNDLHWRWTAWTGALLEREPREPPAPVTIQRVHATLRRAGQPPSSEARAAS